MSKVLMEIFLTQLPLLPSTIFRRIDVESARNILRCRASLSSPCHLRMFQFYNYVSLNYVAAWPWLRNCDVMTADRLLPQARDLAA